MEDPGLTDPYVADVMRWMDPKIRSGLTPMQITAIARALGAEAAKKEAFCLRGLVPLYFTRYYFGLIVARDRTPGALWLEEQRRARTGRRKIILFFLLVSSPLLIALFLLAYLLKTALGWDFFGDYHLYDLLPC